MGKSDKFSQFYVETLPIAFTFWSEETVSRPLFQSNSKFMTFQREKTLDFWITENLKEYIGFVPHLKDVHFFPISQNVDNFPNSERSYRPCPNKAALYSE